MMKEAAVSKEFDWVRSPEIREHLRRSFQPTLRERLFLIRSAYKPMEERLEAMRRCCRRPGPAGRGGPSVRRSRTLSGCSR